MERGKTGEELLRFLINRKTTSLFTQFLQILEEVRDNRYVVNEDLYQMLRKKVLKSSNDSIREFDELLNKLEIGLKMGNNGIVSKNKIFGGGLYKDEE